MILLYAAVILVITGVLLIIYSEFFTDSITKTIPHDRFVPNFDDVLSESKQPVSKAGGVSEKSIVDLDDLPDIDVEFSNEITSSSQDYDTIVQNDAQDKNTPQKNTKGYEVILYVDNSGTIGDSLHLTSNDWSFLTRVGLGYLQYVQQGINITINNKLYRYDFYRISSMKAHDNYMLFTIKGKNAVNCIVLNEESDILLNIEKEYSNFVTS